MTQPVFDGHNDVLLHLWRAGDRMGQSFFDGRAGHVDLPKARAGGLAGGFFAVFVPNGPAQPEPDDGDDGEVLEMPPIGSVGTSQARRATLEIASVLIRMAAARPDAIRICRSAAEIDAAQAAGAIAAILHVEGCEGIGADLDELHVLHAAGLRSLGPVWSRPNIFGHGVPFRFPSSPDTGPGLTDAGRRLVAECNRLGIVVDLSHLNEAGFWEVEKLSDAPLVATHSNVHAIAPSSRNLTDRQLDAIAATGGVVGLNYAVSFLREDGRKSADTPLSVCVAHLAHLVERLGEGGVALGSDFDGALIPEGIGSAAGLQNLVAAMRDAGFGETLIARICWGNWVDLLRRTCG
ncbi:membrane dipeptidase [Paroceanicella profunda]|uniref:Membrane dipeptidase n=1 Tax=Paroceanicella profunda TaxID=2579971 RepID=A0A5B8FVA0_9RHOB|nr:dipeptidase [Paroceanicella profunda]QDL91274.1 membrane dipeptidase [Paroceanicella profunda]